MNFDLDIKNYKNKELMEMFELPNNYDQNILTINEIIGNVTKLRKETDIKFVFDTYYGHAMCYRIFGVTLFNLMNELINGNLIIPRIYPYISDDMFDPHTFVIIYNIVKCFVIRTKY